ncbi:TonB-dependent receptor [Alteriqipengyuania sp. WL0013]|uniref:TonB-dependent receptor n=1 Tax=Alteriqipengyuania sp. WL0013 TaxID=3110773 RepID=UPI002B704979|nr:TonB-dependent receptor [Alteriqipengyuania sp. WL0013]MEB3414903.1 TonB-dependent receptor [Alteriqipengyuania sp. WL0013]
MKTTTVTPRQRHLKRTAFCTVSGLALGFAMAGPAYAQDASPAEQEDATIDDENVIVVEGIRAALENAQSIKRDADTFVDVVTADDIGALPDRSVAEALQRVPGVNISRFEQRDDPDRFSVEGSGVIIRGLPFVRSELNGRDIFSANGGRTLGFNDISPELLGRVEVYKNTTADMIDGGISGTVNLVTRKPLDNPGFNFAGTFEINKGDLADEWAPGFSLLGSNTFDTGIGTFAVQLGYAQQRLVTRTDASQITDPCYRAADLQSGCIRARPVGSGGFAGDAATPDTFPPEGTVIVPKGAGVRTTELTRDRQAYSAVAQYESLDGGVVVTAEYLRAATQSSLSEFAVLALVNNDAFFPVPTAANDIVFNGNVFQSGTLTQISDQGVPGISTETLRFEREDEAMTEDFSLDFDIAITDRLRANFEGQYINSNRSEAGIILAMQTYADLFIDNSGETPAVQFLQVGTNESPAAYFTDPANTYFWFHLDNQVANEGDLYSLRGDFEYDISDTGFLRSARFGARWAERSRVTRTANFSNWSNLGATWAARQGDWGAPRTGTFPTGGGAYAYDFPDSADVRNVFGDNFQRGNVPVPVGDGAAIFYGGDDLVGEYLSGELAQDLNAIKAFTLTPEGRPLIDGRIYLDPVTGEEIPCSPFCPSEITPIEETTSAAYLRLDFGRDFSSGATLSGNIGVRYARTNVRSEGQIGYITPGYVDDPEYEVEGDPTSPNRGGDGDGVAELSDLQNRCANPIEQTPLGYCDLSTERQIEFVEGLNGDIFNDFADETYDHWLPSFNVKLDLGNGLLFRGAVSKAIFRPDLAAFRTGGALFDNTLNIVNQDIGDTGLLFGLNTGNRNLRPTEAWNYDLSAEWYFDAVGSLTATLFMKDVSNLENPGATRIVLDNPDGLDLPVLVNGPINVNDGTLKGFELAYQQTYDFLPGPLGGLGSQLTYTYVDGGEFTNNTLGAEQSPFSLGLPLAGISKHTVNAVVFYERGPIAARLAYNWRSEFLQTPRDVIFPFSPIYGESTGQLDGSLFIDVLENLKVGIQGVNLLDEVTRTSQVFDFDGTRVTRSAFRNDRRYSIALRFDF